jgi:endonuclease YncB( thermonuclease family)
MRRNSPVPILAAAIVAIALYLGWQPALPQTASVVPATQTGSRGSFRGMVVGVTDGDTIKVLVGKQQIKIRFSHIDAPERKQAFGSKATGFLSDLLARAGNQVLVVEDGKDRYGRTLGVVYTTDGKYNFNLAMVENGFAWHYEKYSQDPIYAAAQEYARHNRLGLWSDAQPAVPPWEFR